MDDAHHRTGTRMLRVAIAMTITFAAAAPVIAQPTTSPPAPAPAPDATPPPADPAPTEPPEEEVVPDPDEPETSIQLGGFVFGAVYYDTNSAVNRPWFGFVAGDSDDPSFEVDPLPTRFNITGIRKQYGLEGKGYFEMDMKPGDVARLRHAYASLKGKWGSVTIGQTWALVGGWLFPETFNYDTMPLQGNPYSRQPQITYAYEIGPVTARIAAFRSSGIGTVQVAGALDGTAVVADRYEIPYGQARIELKFLEKGFVAVGAAAGQMLVVFTPDMGSPTAPFSEKYRAGMATFDAVIPIGPLKVSGRFWATQGGGYGSAVGQAAVLSATGDVTPVRAIGGYLNLVVSLPWSTRISAYGAIDNPEDRVDDTPVTFYHNLTAGGLLAKDFLEKFTGGIEVQYGRTKVPGDAFNNTRFYLALRYTL